MHGFYAALTQEMEKMDPDLFFATYRMTSEQLNFVASSIENKITKEDTVMRPVIQVKARLALTLRYTFYFLHVFNSSIDIRSFSNFHAWIN